jgi:hypothetical protein
MKLIPILIVSVQVIECALGSSRRNVGAQVQTSSGVISGHAASNATGVSEYLGIPYAQPPVGNLRFYPPVQLQSPSSVVNGSNFVHIPSPPPFSVLFVVFWEPVS